MCSWRSYTGSQFSKKTRHAADRFSQVQLKKSTQCDVACIDSKYNNEISKGLRNYYIRAKLESVWLHKWWHLFVASVNDPWTWWHRKATSSDISTDNHSQAPDISGNGNKWHAQRQTGNSIKQAISEQCLSNQIYSDLSHVISDFGGQWRVNATRIKNKVIATMVSKPLDDPTYFVQSSVADLAIGWEV